MFLLFPKQVCFVVLAVAIDQARKTEADPRLDNIKIKIVFKIEIFKLNPMFSQVLMLIGSGKYMYNVSNLFCTRFALSGKMSCKPTTITGSHLTIAKEWTNSSQTVRILNIRILNMLINYIIYKINLRIVKIILSKRKTFKSFERIFIWHAQVVKCRTQRFEHCFTHCTCYIFKLSTVQQIVTRSIYFQKYQKQSRLAIRLCRSFNCIFESQTKQQKWY